MQWPWGTITAIVLLLLLVLLLVIMLLFLLLLLGTIGPREDSKELNKVGEEGKTEGKNDGDGWILL